MKATLSKKLQLVVAILVLTNTATAVFLGRAIYDNGWKFHLWESEMDGMAGSAGRTQAVVDFRARRKRLFEIYMVPPDIKQQGKSQFTGRKDGTFEIWTYPCYQILGHPHEDASQTFIKFYNRAMRSLEKRQ